ncbi:MAG: T9SS type A sorting domain-containing protein [Bacteroidia bacterium]
MKKIILSTLLFAVMMISQSSAQLSVFTSPPLNGGNGSNGVTFNIEATSSVFVDTIYVAAYGSAAATIELWYTTSAITGPPNIVAPAWSQLVSASVTPGQTITSGPFIFTPVVIPGGLLMNAGDHFGFFVGFASGANVAYTSHTATNQDVFTDGFVTIRTGPNVGYGGAIPAPAFHPRQFNGGVSYRPASGRDARLAAVVSPNTLSVGPNTVTARVQNAALDPISSIDWGYQLDNNAPVNVLGYSLPSPLSPGQTYDYTFATPVNIPTPGSYSLKVWATNANGLGADVNSGNDTITLNVCTGITGTFTIGGLAADYNNIQEAINALTTCGIIGPVTFNINPGTYHGAYDIGNIPGGSGFTVTFNSQTGLASDVILLQDTALGSSRSHVNITSDTRILFNNLTFRKTLPTTVAGQAAVVFANSAANGEVIGCVFEDQTLANSTFNNGIIYRGSNGLISNNSFSGFYYGVWFDGNVGDLNQAIGNTFANYVYRAIYALNQSNVLLSNNNISHFVGISTAGAGIWASNIYGMQISENNIHGAMSGSGMLFNNLNNDINVPATFHNRVFNNVINGFQASSLTSTVLVVNPFHVTASFSATLITNPRDAVEIVNNTVKYEINTTATSTIQAALWLTGGTAATPAWDTIVVLNNHFEVNPVSGNLPANFRLIRFSIQHNADVTLINHNNYRLGGTTPPNLVRINSPITEFATLSDWQAATSKDLNSVSLDPIFVAPTVLIPTNIAFDNLGTPISYVASDLLGNPRSVSTPDIGAYEFVGRAFSQIDVNVLGDTVLGTSRSVTANISDSISAIVAGSPRMFYKKATQTAWLLDTLPSISGSNYTFLIDYNALGGVSNMETIEYYIAAENAGGTVTTAPLGGEGLYLSNAVPPLAIFSYTIFPVLSGAYRVGVSGPADFPTLTAASNFFNSGLVATPVEFILIDNMYSTAESFPITFESRPGVSATNTVTIRPDSVLTSVTIIGESGTSSGLININGLSHLTISGTDVQRNLNIINTTVLANTAAILVRSLSGNTVSGLTIKDLNVWGGSSATISSFGIAMGGAVISTTFSGDSIRDITIDNITVERAYYGIYLRNSTANPGNNIRITNSKIGSTDTSRFVIFRGIDMQAVRSSLIEGNEIFNLIGLSNTTSQAGIEIGNAASNDVQILRNKIWAVHNNNTGGWGAWGINLMGGNNHVVANNVIYDVRTVNYSATTSTFNPFGIRITSGTNIGVYYNSIYMYGDMTNTNGSAAAAAGFGVTSTIVTGEFRNNVIGVDYTSNATGAQHYVAVWFPTNYNFTNFNSNNNAYHVADNANHFVGRIGLTANTGLSPDVPTWRAVSSVNNGTNDQASIPLAGKSLPPFTSISDLTIPAATVTAIESGAVEIAALGLPNTDYTGLTRPAFGGANPDMGAYEFDGVASTVLPTIIDSVVVDPVAAQCTPVSRTVTAHLSGTNSLVSVTMHIDINGIAQTPIPMSLQLQLAGSSIWSGTLPAASSGDLIELVVVAVDTIGDTVTFAAGSYMDLVLSVDAGQDVTINAGDSTTLSATTNVTMQSTLSNLADYSTATTNCGGGFMFEITPAISTVITGFDLIPHNVGVQTVGVFYRVGSKAGQQNTPMAWIQEGSYSEQVMSNSAEHYLALTNGIPLAAGQTISVYLQYHSRYITGLDTLSNADMIITNGEGLCTNWTACCSPRKWIGSVYYGNEVNIVWSEAGSSAPMTATIGTGTLVNTNISYPAPYGNYYWGARHQMLIPAPELAAQGLSAGLISSLAFDVAQVNGVGLNDFTIKMGHTTEWEMVAWETGLSTVYSEVSYTEVAGWNVHQFQTPFQWNGVDNLVVEVCFNNSGWTGNAAVRQTQTPYPSTIFYRADASGVCGSTATTNFAFLRPNMQLGTSGGAIVGTGSSIVVAPNVTTTYKATAFYNGCMAEDTVTVNVTMPNNQLSGVVRYANTNSTPMSNSTAILIDDMTGQIAASAATDANGAFNFVGVPNGNYSLSATTNKAWGGVNATDALAIGNYFIGSLPLSGIKLMAADVNVSSTVNSTDALLVARRFVGLDNSFPSGDWLFEATSIGMAGFGQQNEDVFGLCYGDVNASYTPNGSRIAPKLAIEWQGFEQLGSESKVIPVSIDRNRDMGALSAVFTLPQGVAVEHVRAIKLSTGFFEFKQEGNELRIGWFSTSSVNLQAGDLLFELEMRADGGFEGDIAIGEMSEAANGLAEVYPMTGLRMPVLRSSEVTNFSSRVYPNPARDLAWVEYSLPASGKVTIRVTDALGKLVYQQTERPTEAGVHQLQLEAEKLSAGTYHVTLIYNHEGDIAQQLLKLQVVK